MIRIENVSQLEDGAWPRLEPLVQKYAEFFARTIPRGVPLEELPARDELGKQIRVRHGPNPGYQIWDWKP